MELILWRPFGGELIEFHTKMGKLRNRFMSGLPGTLRHGIPGMREGGSLPSAWAIRSSNSQKRRVVVGVRLYNR